MHSLTIDGYRTAIVDTLGPVVRHISQSSELFVVLNQLSKAHFESMKDTNLKHLTLKTAFLPALTSSNHHSEIHTWVANKVSNLCRREEIAFCDLLGLLRWGFGGPNYASLSLESSQHIYKFLPKRPYLVR